MMRFLSPRRYGGTVVLPPTDPYFADVLSLVHFDDLAFVDQIPHTWTITGSPATSIAESKFGNRSLELTSGTTNYIYDESIWAALPSINPDLTIEFWLYLNSITGNYNRVMVTYHSDSLTASGYVFENSQFTGNADFGWRTSYGNLLPLANLSLGQWYHIALSITGGVARYFIDGVLQSTLVDNNIGGYMTGYCFGSEVWGGNQPDGYIDECRITKYGRYTSNFTPPIAAFPDS